MRAVEKANGELVPVQVCSEWHSLIHSLAQVVICGMQIQVFEERMFDGHSNGLSIHGALSKGSLKRDGPCNRSGYR